MQLFSLIFVCMKLDIRYVLNIIREKDPMYISVALFNDNIKFPLKFNAVRWKHVRYD